MTTIIGVQHDDGCTFLADSRTTDSSGRIYSHSSVKKLSECGPAIVGGSGEVMPCDITQHIWVAPPLTVRDKKDPFHYMITKAMPSLRKCLIQHGYNFDEPHSGETRFQFLIAVNGEIFDVDQDLAVSRVEDGIYAVGSGAPYAIGALHAGASIMEAMEIAAKVTAFTAPPYIRMEQKKSKR